MPKKILIIRLSAIGDVMHCTPVASSLKAAWPDCKITWLIGEVAADLIKYNPHIDEIIIWPRERFEKHFRNFEFQKARELWGQLQKKLATKSYYAVLDIHGLFITGLIAKQVRAERRIGLSGARELNSLFMTETAKPLGPHITERYLGVLQALGIRQVERKMDIHLLDGSRFFAERFLRGENISSNDKFIVLIPGTTWPAKTWPISFFAETARLLAKDYRIVLCGGGAEEEMGRKIIARVNAPIANAIGRTGLLEMAAILERAAGVVAGDTGPLHIAAALGVPTVTILGPTDPAIIAPQGGQSAAVFSKQACSFCHKRKCPKGEAKCMREVLPEAVVREVYKIAKKSRSKVGFPSTRAMSNDWTSK